MTTSFTDIYDIFLTQIEDYKIDLLYKDSPERFSAYLFGFLKLAIADFSHICSKDIETYSESDGTFSSDLSLFEKKILGSRMSIYWLTKNISDIRQMNLKIQDKDFKFYAEANNLKAKQDWLKQITEESDKDFTRYELAKIDLTTWA